MHKKTRQSHLGVKKILKINKNRDRIGDRRRI